MKSIFRLLSFALLGLCVNTLLLAQWVQTNGPHDPRPSVLPFGGGKPSNACVWSLAVTGATLFAGTDCGVFLSTDSGASWTAKSEGLTNLNVHSVFVNGRFLLAGTAGLGAFRSSDDGATWADINSGLTSKLVFAFAVSGNKLFAGTSVGVFVSVDSGTSWTRVNSGLPDAAVYALAVSPAVGGPSTNLFAGTSGHGVFVSTDDGTNWAAVNTGLMGSSAFALARCDTGIFAAVSGHAYLSTDNGTTWTRLNPSHPKTVRAIAVDGRILYIGTSTGVSFSTDWGTSWTQTTPMDDYVNSLAVSGGNLFAGTTSGVWRLTR